MTTLRVPPGHQPWRGGGSLARLDAGGALPAVGGRRGSGPACTAAAPRRPSPTRPRARRLSIRSSSSLRCVSPRASERALAPLARRPGVARAPAGGHRARRHGHGSRGARIPVGADTPAVFSSRGLRRAAPPLRHLARALRIRPSTSAGSPLLRRGACALPGGRYYSRTLLAVAPPDRDSAPPARPRAQRTTRHATEGRAPPSSGRSPCLRRQFVRSGVPFAPVWSRLPRRMRRSALGPEAAGEW